MPAQTHPAYETEKQHLQKTIEVVREEKRRAEEDQITTLQELQYAQRFDPDKLPIREILYTKAVQTLRNMTLAEKRPYFTRIDFIENGADTQVYYIGKYGVTKSDTLETTVVDWRAPLANLYYSGQLGHVEYTAPDGKIEGELTLKRQFDIADGEIQSIFDTDIVSQDAYLQSALEQMNGERLKEIVTTIQAEQNFVIRYPLRQSLIVQGVAGSGKTTIALHRIAYLLYAFRDQLRPENMMIIAPNPLFLNYIAGVLPDLGVDRVKQTTFPLLLSGWLGKNMGKIDFHDRTEEILTMSPEKRARLQAIFRLKGSNRMLDALDKYFKHYEANFCPENGIAFGPVVLWSKQEMEKFLLVDEAPFPMTRRVSEFRKQLSQRTRAALTRLENWFMDECDRRARKIREESDTDPAAQKARIARLYQSRDERIRQMREQVKPFENDVIKSLPSMEPVSVYRTFWEYVSDDPEFRDTAAYTLEHINARKPLEPEDAAPIAYLAMKLTELERFDIRHVVVDEAQDFSPFEFFLLSRMMPAATFTVVGDLMQGIHSWRGMNSWREMIGLPFGEGCIRHKLTTSYRSTVEIMSTALRVAQNRPTPEQTEVHSVIRHGEEPEFASFASEKEQARMIEDTIRKWQNGGMRVIAVVGRNARDLKALAANLPESLHAKILNPEDTEYEGNVLIAPAAAVKGLEFDGVIVADAGSEFYPDTELDARLLYVVLTRPLHQLKVLYHGTLTPLLIKKE